ncbi:nitroreductase family protein [Bacteroides sp. 224]|uniref:nitroreductase family protein n=1 Tax=Bacteroides sp. 224 TaxID=2302936 RepID=UPI0013D67C15|nr:nitroreductase family protein [Bacteroides sp. 224]NDV64302.1 nitroreductase family protein [Bacteroides sp. 224]
MKRTFLEAMIHRRTFYTISNHSPITVKEIEAIINEAVLHVPSAYNSQTTRVVLLLGKSHLKLWKIVEEALKEVMKGKSFDATKAKIDNCFACGYGTILFFEDQAVVEKLQKTFPTYKDNFPIWSQHTAGMHQFAIWTMLEDAGLGASLQHYNPLIDKAVAETWSLPEEWKLIAQMPFGTPIAEPGGKEFESLAKRVKVFK